MQDIGFEGVGSADDGGHADQLGGADQFFDLAMRQIGVFAVDDDEVETGHPDHFDKIWRGEFHEGAEHRFVIL